MNPPPETDADCRDRHLRMCQRLAELGMAMAEAAAARAIQTADAPEPGTPDPTLAFARISHSVRQSITLEARIRAGTVSAIPRAAPLRPTAQTQNDTRREPIRRILHSAVEDAPNRAAARREIDERLDIELALDPDQRLTTANLIDHLCETLNIEPEFGKLPDDLLEAIAPDPW